MCMSGRWRCSGFTLVELLVAIFVLSLMTAFAYRAIQVLRLSHDSVQRESSWLINNLQKNLLRIESDLMASTEVRYSDAGAAAIWELQGVSQRVLYWLEAGELYRSATATTLEGNKQSGMPLMTGLEAFSIEYSSASGEWLQFSAGLPSSQALSALAAHFSWKEGMTVRRVLRLADNNIPADFSSLPEVSDEESDPLPAWSTEPDPTFD